MLRGSIQDLQTVLCSCEFVLLRCTEPPCVTEEWCCWGLTRCTWGWSRRHSIMVFGSAMPTHLFECGAEFWEAGGIVCASQLVQFVRWPWTPVLEEVLETGESSYSGNTGTPLSVPQRYGVAYPSKPFFGWVGEFRISKCCICALFSPLGEKEQSCKARNWSCHWELGRDKDKCTAGVCRAGHIQARWPRVTLSKAQGLTVWCGLGWEQYCHGVVGLPLFTV